MTPILVFDIETVPDVDGIRRLNAIDASLPDSEVIAWFGQQRRAATGNDFAPIHLQKVVAIGCALRRADDLRVWSVGDPADQVYDIILIFFEVLE
jgi:predicted PolB exonuclease-like 3'-5' exonuclease